MSLEKLQLFTLKNKAGSVLEILNLGATIFSLKLRGEKADFVNVVVGPKNKEDYLSKAYLEENMCFGASIGRYAGRITNGEFYLNDKKYTLYEKNGVHLHGGERGFQHKSWKKSSETTGENPSITLSCLSEDGEEGYPGNLQVKVCYTLAEDNQLKIEYSAVSDKETVVNLTNHTYFNLNGGGDVQDHELQINASGMLEVDEKLRPTGKINNLSGQPKDFSISKKIDSISVDDTYVLDKSQTVAARVFSAKTNIEMILITDQPGVVVFIPKQLPQAWEYNNGAISEFPSICLEAQNFPDAPNHNIFPSTVLMPGETYKNNISYKFNFLHK